MSHKTKLDLTRHREPLLAILRGVIATPDLGKEGLNRLLRENPKDGRGFFRRAELVLAYRQLAGSFGLPPFDATVLERIRRKPTRTASGVTVVTVLTKPYPCPGTCIFCPSDIRMPKSYLVDEPGAQRAEQNAFDPYLQTYTRLQTYYNIGHPTDKIEVIILGGTWSFYPESYQIWFVKRIFDALHDFGDGVDRMVEVEAALLAASGLHPQNNTADVTLQGIDLARTYNQVVGDIYADETPVQSATWSELEAAHIENESAACRCVGLVVETRPDHISRDEVIRIRRLGCTKVQIGFQSLDDDVLRLNKRGHDVAATRRAVRLLRGMGFKIHAHWMPNLYGSSPQADIADYDKLFRDPDFCPDELKIYPCSLIESAELMKHYEDGSWRPYSREELLKVLTACFVSTPEYCRLTRVVRDIPSPDIVDGNKLTNFRQLVEANLAERGLRSPDIRGREIRQRQVAGDELTLDEHWFPVSTGQEVFLQYITPGRQIAGFLRLSLPTDPPLVEELAGAAMIREVHVYGQAVDIGEASSGRAQHLGLGTELIERAAEIARERGYERLAVISSVGTRAYYRKRGFGDGALYQVREL